MKRSSEVSMNGQTSEFPFRDFQLPGITTTLTDIESFGVKRSTGCLVLLDLLPASLDPSTVTDDFFTASLPSNQ